MELRELEKQFSIEDRHFWFAARRRLVREVLERSLRTGPAAAGSRRILEVSCATGRNLVEFADLGRTLGIDLSVEAVRFCRERGAQVVRADAQSLPLADGSVDVVLALDALEHLERDDLALREVRRVLQPGGLALLTVPACPALWSPHDEAFHHLRRYRGRDLRRLLAAAGLEIERLTGFSSFLLPPLFVWRRLRSLLEGSAGEVPRSDFHLPLPRPLTALLAGAYGLERALLRQIDLPFGTSLLAVARRSNGAPR